MQPIGSGPRPSRQGPLSPKPLDEQPQVNSPDQEETAKIDAPDGTTSTPGYRSMRGMPEPAGGPAGGLGGHWKKFKLDPARKK